MGIVNKKKMKRGRPSADDILARSTIEEQAKIEEAVSESVMEALETVLSNMRNKDAPFTVRQSAAKEVLTMHARFYKMRVKDELEDDEDTNEDEETAVVFKFNAS